MRIEANMRCQTRTALRPLKTWILVQITYRSLREQLVANGQLVPGPDARFLVFQDDVAFASPSAAAAMFGGNQNGPMTWKIKGTGQTYKDWKEDRVFQAGANTGG